MSKTQTLIRDWVDCPICGESDMQRETDAYGHAIISCVNHACGSNGGNNFIAIEPMFRPKDYESIRVETPKRRVKLFPNAGVGRRLRSWARSWTR